ncbi:hypothetical protein ACK8HJ_20260 [Vreelandella titanicae]|uniref:hypothetical protein n=1 Tax=Vreelandella titanicae TaxID=664683 RepID=UPI001F1B8ECB|nr:hypothetical protein [Halomonas titanicae]
MSAHSPTHWLEEAELLRVEPEPPTDARAGNVAAFLDTLAFARRYATLWPSGRLQCDRRRQDVQQLQRSSATTCLATCL